MVSCECCVKSENSEDLFETHFKKYLSGSNYEGIKIKMTTAPSDHNTLLDFLNSLKYFDEDGNPVKSYEEYLLINRSQIDKMVKNYSESTVRNNTLLKYRSELKKFEESSVEEKNTSDNTVRLSKRRTKRSVK